MLASSVIRALQEQDACRTSSQRSKIAYAFSDKNDETKKQASTLIRAIIWQVMTCEFLTIENKRDIVTAYQNAGIRNLGADSSIGLLSFLTSTLQRVLCMLERVTLVFDGLDECEDGPEFLQKIMQLSFPPIIDVRMIFVSQKTEAISQILRKQCIWLDMDSNAMRSLTNIDISTWVRSKLLENTSVAAIRTNTDEITNKIVIKADGMFLWARLATPEIIDRFREAGLSTYSVFDLIDQLPEKMDKTFLYLFSRVTRNSPELGVRRNEQRRNRLITLFRWVFHTMRPMTLEELQEAMSIESQNSNDGKPNTETSESLGFLVSLGYPLIHLQDGKVCLVHSSFREFIEPQHQQFSKAITDILEGQSFETKIVQHCLRYLNQKDLDFDRYISIDNPNLSKHHPFLAYACESWVSHLLGLSIVPEFLQEAVVRFLKSDHAVTWLELYCESKSDTHAIPTLQSRLFSHVKALEDPNWPLQLLQKSVQERSEECADSETTIRMSERLGAMYRDLEMFPAAEKSYHLLAQHLRRRGGDEDAIYLMFQRDRALLYKHQGKYDEAVSLLKMIHEEFSRFKGDFRHFCIVVRTDLGQCYHKQGRLDEAYAIFAEEHEKRKALSGDHDTNTLILAHDMASCQLEQGEFDKAKVRTIDTLAKAIQGLGQSANLTLILKGTLSMAEAGLGHFQEALQLDKEVYNSRLTSFGHDHPETITANVNLAASLHRVGRLSDASQKLEHILEYHLRTYRERHPKTLTVMNNLAANYCSQNLYQKSADMHLRALGIQKELLGPLHLNTLNSLNNLGNAYCSLGLCDKAKPVLLEALNGYNKALGKDNPLTWTVFSNIGDLCLRQGSRFALASQIYTQLAAKAKAMSSDGQLNPKHLSYQTSLAEVYRFRGRLAQATQLARKTSKLAGKVLDGANPLVLFSKQVLATSLFQQHHLDEAEKIQTEVLQIVEERHSAIPRLIQSKEHTLALIQHAQGRSQVALDIMLRIHGTAVEDHGSNSKVVLGIEAWLAQIYQAMGHLDISESHSRRCLDHLMTSTSSGPENLVAIACMSTLGKNLFLKNLYLEAKEFQQRAVSLRMKIFGEHHPLTLTSMYDLARTLSRLGHQVESQKLLNKVLTGRQALFQHDDHEIIEAEEALAQARSTPPTAKSPCDVNVDLILSSYRYTEPDILEAIKEATELLGEECPQTLSLKLAALPVLRERDTKAVVDKFIESLLRQSIKLNGTHDTDTLQILDELVVQHHGEQPQWQKDFFSPGIFWAIKLNECDLLDRLLTAGGDHTSAESESSLTPLSYATRERNVKAVEVLLRHGASIDHIGGNGQTALSIAVENCDIVTVRYLLASKANTGIFDAKNLTPLMRACTSGNEALVSELLQSGVPADHGEDTLQALHFAAMRNSKAIVDLLLEFGANIESRAFTYTPLLGCIANGSFEMFKHLVQKGASTVARADDESCLQFACKKGRKDMAIFLIDHGGDPNEYTSYGYNAAHCAAKGGNIQLLEQLQLKGMDINSLTHGEKQLSMLAIASSNGHSNLVKWLLKQGVKPDTPLSQSVRALHLASVKGGKDTVLALLQAGASPNPITDSGKTPLCEAIFALEYDVAELLLDNGAKAIEPFSGTSPLLYAISRQRFGLARLLVSKGSANVNFQMERSGLGALYFASWLGSSEMVAFLLEHGARINITTTDHSTPLHVASARRHPQVAQTLISRGADRGLYDRFGRTALDWAEEDMEIRALFGTEFELTPLTTRVRKAWVSIGDLCREAKDAPAKRRPYLFDGLAVCLLFVSRFNDAHIAYEQTIESEKSNDMIKQYLVCSFGHSLEDVVGEAYVCKTCSMCVLCKKCLDKYHNEEKPRYCSHDNFMTVPRPCWKDLEPGVVGPSGTTLEEWLSGLEHHADERLCGKEVVLD